MKKIFMAPWAILLTADSIVIVMANTRRSTPRGLYYTIDGSTCFVLQVSDIIATLQQLAQPTKWRLKDSVRVPSIYERQTAATPNLYISSSHLALLLHS